MLNISTITLTGFPVEIKDIYNILLSTLETYKKEVEMCGKSSVAMLQHFLNHSCKKKEVILELVDDCIKNLKALYTKSIIIDEVDKEWTFSTLTCLGFANCFESIMLSSKYNCFQSDLLKFLVLPYFNTEFSWEFRVIDKKEQKKRFKNTSFEKKDIIMFGVVNRINWDKLYFDKYSLEVCLQNQYSLLKPERRKYDYKIENMERLLLYCYEISNYFNKDKKFIQTYTLSF
jgi:hypothetical protein